MVCAIKSAMSKLVKPYFQPGFQLRYYILKHFGSLRLKLSANGMAIKSATSKLVKPYFQLGFQLGFYILKHLGSLGLKLKANSMRHHIRNVQISQTISSIRLLVRILYTLAFRLIIVSIFIYFSYITIYLFCMNYLFMILLFNSFQIPSFSYV